MLHKNIKPNELTMDFINNELLKPQSKSGINTNKIRYMQYISQKDIFDFINKKTDTKCPFCDKDRNFDNYSRGYLKTCGTKDCINMMKSKQSIYTLSSRTEEQKKVSYEKAKKTRLLKYGDENYNNSEKRKETCTARYGVEYTFQDEKVKEKAKKTRLLKYGDENYNNSEKRKETCTARYGVENAFQDEKVKEKAAVKRKETCTARYGVENVFGVPDIIKNMNYRKLVKYETANIDNLNKDYWVDNFSSETFNIKECMEYHNISRDYANKNKIKFEINTKNNSRTQDEISELIPDSISDTRKNIHPYELDIYSEKYKFAVEYNGILWHSSGLTFPNQSKDKNYHLMKTELCEEKGIQLFHIFENEWLDENKKDIWISMIRGKQGLHTRLGARKCSIQEISSKEAREFLDENHMQGSVNGSIRIALIYDNKIVSLMTFGKARMSKKYEYELLRFCTKKNLTVQGAGSRLLKYFEDVYNPDSLVSYANRRWSEGNLYEKLDFTFIHNSAPNMFWFKSGSMFLESRQKYQKHKLKDIEGFIFDEVKTAKENMFLNNYRVIYDSGNKVYTKVYK